MRKSKHKSPIWPYLGVLGCLFVLSLTAPRAWKSRPVVLRAGASAKIERPSTPVAPSAVAAAEADTPVATETWPTETPREQAATLPEIELPAEPQRPTPVFPATGPTLVPPAPEFAEQVVDDPATDPDWAPELAEPKTPEDSQPELQLSPERIAQLTPTTRTADLQSVPVAESSPVKSAPLKLEPNPAEATPIWPVPRGLIQQLQAVSESGAAGAWAGEALERINLLCRQANDSRQTAESLALLKKLATSDVTPTDNLANESHTIRSRYALRRWVDVWEAAAALSTASTSETDSTATTQQINHCLDQVERQLDAGATGAQWRAFLKLKALRDAAQTGETAESRRELARLVLDRVNSNRLTPSQKRLLASGPIAALAEELRGWAAETVTADQLLAHLEQYEFSGLNSDGRLVANDLRGLRWSAPRAAQQLSEAVDAHYRNGNVRLAVTDELLNRILPQPDRIDAPVRDRVMNVPVRGRSSTFTKLSIRLIPDPSRIRIGLEADGLVASDTVSTSGPASFRNSGQSSFLVRKLFVLGPQGLAVWPAMAEAESNYQNLIAMETDFDGMPLFGPLVRSIARNQHDEMKGEAVAEATQKVSVRARNQLDAEINARLKDGTQKMENSQLATLRRLGLDLVPVALSTSDERAAARVRLSTAKQLGAHTPRPRAPSDCWFSLQLHESALNNGLTQLDLNGRSFELHELFDWIAKKLDKPDLAKLDDIPDGVRVTFAAQDAVRLRCVDGRVQVTLAIEELKQGGKSWRKFEARAHYRPEAEGLTPRFVPDGSVSLAGRSVQGKVDFKLRSIFTKVLLKRDLRLLNESITSDPRMQDLAITQFQVDDGWMALAYSPKPAGDNVARRPKR